MLVGDEVARDDLLFCVAEDALEFGRLGRLLEGGEDLFTLGGLLGSEGQVDDGDVGGRDPDGHTGQLAVELRQDLSDGLGGTGRCRDGVVQCTTSGTPILSTLGGTVDDELVGRRGMDRGHETFDDTELLVQDLGHRRETVGRTRRVGEDVGTGVFGVVDTHDVHGSIGRRCRDDDLLASTRQVLGGLFDGGEDTSRFTDDGGTDLTPLDLFGVTFGEELDLRTVDDEAVTLEGDLAGVLAMDGIVLELVRSVLRGKERVVDSDDGRVGVLKCRTADETADTSESVDTKLSRHD
mmetsp:Transcript_62525/g.152226  ORF Transcript_62525/g.152226 Transcript_62525/m.152226 type:complete len:294 (+) Transcript_62525:420-1301(+)